MWVPKAGPLATSSTPSSKVPHSTRPSSPSTVAKKGLYAEQLEQWRRACETANDWDREYNLRLKTEKKVDRQRIRQLERELTRKEKALAEAAALLVLRKKAEAIWGEVEDE